MTFTDPVIINTQCALGEGAYYSPGARCAYWADIKGCALYHMEWATKQVHKHLFDEPVCWVVERQNGGLLVGFERGIYYVDPITWARTLVCHADTDMPSNRLNDACVDRKGNLYFGTMDNNEVQPSGALYRLNRDFSLSRLDSNYIVSNGPAFSPCGNWLYTVASCKRTVYRMQVEADGSLSNKRPWIIFDETMGVPDGLTADNEGCLWVAAWDGGGVFQFSPQGIQQRFVPLPAPRITSVAFAGDNFDRLLVTSASTGLTAGQQQAYPDSGSTFLLDVGARGLAPSPAHY